MLQPLVTSGRTTLPEATGLLADLDAALRPAGLVLHRSPGGVEIMPEATCRDPERLQQLLRAQHTVHGLTATDATVLTRAHAGTLDVGRLGNDGQVVLARLLNAGILDDDHELTDEVGFSLGLA